MGDNNTQTIVGISDIAIKMHNGIVRSIKNVKYVPNLKRNLISLRILEDVGHMFKSENNILK